MKLPTYAFLTESSYYTLKSELSEKDIISTIKFFFCNTFLGLNNALIFILLPGYTDTNVAQMSLISPKFNLFFIFYETKQKIIELF